MSYTAVWKHAARQHGVCTNSVCIIPLKSHSSLAWHCLLHDLPRRRSSTVLTTDRIQRRSGGTALGSAAARSIACHADVVFLALLWRLRYELSLRDVVELELER